MYHFHFTHPHEFLNIVPIIMFLYHSYQKLCHTSKTYQNLQETLITQILSSILSFSLTPLIIFLKHLTFLPFLIVLGNTNQPSKHHHNNPIHINMTSKCASQPQIQKPTTKLETFFYLTKFPF